MFVFETKIRVRYADTDQMGYVYNGNYATYYEVGRTEALRSLGMTYKSMEEEGVMLPVLEMKSKFFKPIKYDELITVKVIIEKKPGVRILFKYDIYNENNEHVHTGETTMVFVDMQKNKPCMPPESFADRLNPFFE
ncbi:thioesterase superfamily protein [Pseudopedobacter saltans DSM 12145]|uniref:Thioesterase superfamily protein n=1 Tax=Pseudopedobacter saltans (strain ATCC 51119 / DSM 12145 / JCM 21818 / CCUG 39354 / LMG 10337 / NBRC 100064 / NCIMB 13643) TaxID=762903 RepID=F0SBK4_PSESL|nr:thioesterase family protein [Pseudopedobacter saltans]ADY51650.1 thioesterase superfamily protein [Pseudopedobacter saltans DSM 12145]